jgi:DHA2 family multidrug resistance protein-like MFS transporter
MSSLNPASSNTCVDPRSPAQSQSQSQSRQEPAAPAADSDGVPMPRRLAAVAAILGALVLVVLDGAIANVALPHIAQRLNATPSDAVWVVTAYQLVVVMFLLPASALGERIGYRRVFVSGIALFTAASALCAMAPSLPWLVAGRCLQGLGSAAVMPLGLALLRFTYPKRLLGQAIAYNALTVAGASAAGPAVGAAILSVASWPWLFAVNLPVGALVLLAARGLPATPGTRQALDLWSVALNAGLFAAFVLGGDRVLEHPVEGGALLIAAAVCLTLLVRRELPRAAPLIPLDLLRSPPFRMSIIASVCCFTGQMASYVALPFYMHHVLGLGVLDTGLLMTPWPLAVMAAAPLAGKLADRISTSRLCAAGAGCLAAGLALCAAWPMQADSTLPLVAFTVLAGLGFGFFQTPNNRNMLLSAPKERSGAAGGAQGVARLTGQTLGSLLMGLLFAWLPAAKASHAGLGLAAGFALIAGLVSLGRGETHHRT